VGLAAATLPVVSPVSDVALADTPGGASRPSVGHGTAVRHELALEALLAQRPTA